MFSLQNIIDDKCDKKQWPFLSDPAPITTTSTTVRYLYCIVPLVTEQIRQSLKFKNKVSSEKIKITFVFCNSFPIVDNCNSVIIGFTLLSLLVAFVAGKKLKLNEKH